MSMDTFRVGVDVDEVQHALAQPVTDLFNKQHGTSHDVSSLHRYRFRELWRLADFMPGDDEDHQAFEHRLENEYIASDGHLAQEPIIGALEIMRSWKNMGADLVALTARHAGDHGEYTQARIDNQFPGLFSDIVYTKGVNGPEDSKVSKGSRANELTLNAHIDDITENARDVARAGMTGFVFGRYAWNCPRLLERGMYRASDWSELSWMVISLAEHGKVQR